jgi:enoyl-CoA hydratase
MTQHPRAVVTETTGSIAIVRFDRPTERNPLSLSTLQELESTLSALTPDNDIQTIIFTGTADSFLSGANIRELAQLDPGSALEFSRFGQRVMQMIADAPQATIAAINGYCIGGGLDLALACDLRLASRTASFAHPGARLGIITGWGGTQRLPRIIGRSRAIDLFVTGRRMGSEEALSLGLITRIGDPVIDCALAIGRSELPDSR